MLTRCTSNSTKGSNPLLSFRKKVCSRHTKPETLTLKKENPRD
ncbi:hypothetical protein PI27_gp005 [Listeria phage WIL-1]|nr:hypothetical protein PI27_gp005 [Listeria phage WIL-1]